MLMHELYDFILHWIYLSSDIALTG